MTADTELDTGYTGSGASRYLYNTTTAATTSSLSKAGDVGEEAEDEDNDGKMMSTLQELTLGRMVEEGVGDGDGSGGGGVKRFCKLMGWMVDCLVDRLCKLQCLIS